MRTRQITLAATQMDVTPAPTPDRLERARRLATEAAGAGADLIVLPEVFNTGYVYSDANYDRAETLDGRTVNWMRDTARNLNVHLAGSLLLWDGGEIYNALLLVAPEGRVWRYDKRYPWGWERAYFRPGRGVTVARTALGDVGMLICWDAAHRSLWRSYAGRVQLMLVSSCPPNISNPTYSFRDGTRVTLDEMGPVMRGLRDTAQRVWGTMLERQTAWLGVPAVNTVGNGRFETAVPNGPAALGSILPVAPWLVKYLPRASGLRLACDMVQGCKIVGADGRRVAQRTQAEGEGFVTGSVTLPAEPPRPATLQPGAPISRLAYLVSDVLLPGLCLRAYRQGVRQRCEM